MKFRDLLNNTKQDIAFNQRVTNIGLISIMVLAVPLIIYVYFINKEQNFEHPLSTISNKVLFLLLFILSIFFKKIPYLIKRTLLVSILFFFGLKAIYVVNIEFMASVFLVLITYIILTSTPKTSIIVSLLIIALFAIIPVLSHYHIISFYYNPEKYHFDTEIITMRIGNTLLAIGFMGSLIFYVFGNNKSNIALLESNINQIIDLNEELQQEINDRKMAEMLAVEHAHNYLTLFNNSFDGFILTTEDHTILEINRAMLNIAGFERHELINKNLFDLLDYSHKHTIEKIKEYAIKGDEIPNVFINIESKSGENLILQIQAVAIKGQSGYNFLSIIKDVTKQHIIMEELGKREQLYRTLFEKTNDAILIMNGNKVVDYNAVANDLYAIKNSHTSTQLPYSNTEQEFDEPNDSVHLPVRVSLALAGQPQSFEWKHTFTSDRETIDTLVNLQDLKILGPKYYMVVEKNITDQKKNQNMILNSIIQTEENERKRISSDLHDGIGPLLTTIKLYTQALSDTEDAQKQTMIKEKLVALIEDAVNSISEISFNISPHILLNYGIIAAVNSFIEKFSINEKMEIEFIHDELERIDEHIEITIYRLFTELINNTMKHSKATKVLFRIIDNGQSIQLNYQDNGVGFDPEKVHENKKGMGLENFRSRIQSFNGLFLLKSKPGSGLYVKIVLPKTI